MNGMIENIKTRRSTRFYDSKPVSREDLETILDAAIYAPSGMNQQPWQVTAIQSPDVLAELTGVIKNILINLPDEPQYQWMKPFQNQAKKEGFTINYNAPNFIVVSGNPQNITPTEDCTMVLHNIFLAAHSMGLATCWIHVLTIFHDHPELKTFLGKIGVPEGYRVYGSTALGYSSKALPKAPERKHAETVIV